VGFVADKAVIFTSGKTNCNKENWNSLEKSGRSLGMM
jgi:hypothetical protein